jgi:hypothetical protein
LTQEVVESTSLFSLTQYLASQDVSTVLSRSYQVAEFQWTAAQTPGTVVTPNLNFPVELWNQTWVKNVLASYTYFRCSGVKVAFRIQSTSMHQGCLNISQVFNEPAGSYDTKNGSYLRRRNNRPVLFSAMPGNSQVVEIPWNNPEQWCRIVEIAGNLFNIGTISVDVISQLKSVAAVQLNAVVSVYASFIDPEVAGPSVYIAQGANKEVKSKGKSKSSGNPISEAVNLASNSVTEVINSISKPLEAATSLISSALPLAALVLDKPPDLTAPTPVYSKPGMGQLTITGSCPEVVLGSTGTSMLTQQEGSMGPGVPNPNLYSIMRTPAYLNQQVFNATTPTFAINVTPKAFALAGSDNAPTFCAYFCQPFAYWRGSLTYQLFFIASAFTSARIRVTWTPEAANPVVIAGQQGNIISRVIEIRGDTHSAVTVPYAKPELWSELWETGGTVNAKTQENGVLQFDIISISGIAASPSFEMLVYQHAGPDFQVGRYSPKLFQTSTVTGQVRRFYVAEGSNEETGFQASVWEYSDVHKPIIDSVGLEVSGYAQSEEYADIASLLKRFHRTTFGNSPGTGSFFPPVSGVYLDGSRDPVSLMANCFRYYRGGIRLQYVRNSTAANKHLYLFTDNDISMDVNQGTVDTTIRVNIPWFSPYPFVKKNITLPGASQFGVVTEAGETPGILLWAFADDVGVSALFSPPILRSVVN